MALLSLLAVSHFFEEVAKGLPGVFLESASPNLVCRCFACLPPLRAYSHERTRQLSLSCPRRPLTCELEKQRNPLLQGTNPFTTRFQGPPRPHLPLLSLAPVRDGANDDLGVDLETEVFPEVPDMK